MKDKYTWIMLYRCGLAMIPSFCTGFSLHGFMGTCVMIVCFHIETSYAIVKESRAKRAVAGKTLVSEQIS